MSAILANYSFLPLKRQRAVRNRSNNATPGPTPSKRANRLPVLPELSVEQDSFSSSSSSASSSSSSSISPNRKRLSRYGKDQFAFGGAFHLDDGFLRDVPRAAPRPPAPASAKPMRQSVRLSAFDIIIDIPASEPASPIRETPTASSTPHRPHDFRQHSPHRARSPTPSLTSMSACSSTEMPLTPGASDDEWSYLQPSRKTIASPLVSFHPLVVSRSTPSLLNPEASPVETFEFTLAPLSPLPGTEAAEGEDEDEASWYIRELSQIVSLPAPCASSSTPPARPDSLPPPPRGSSSNTSLPAGRGRMSKPLPALPHTPGPSPQLDPTFPRRKSRASRPTPPPLPISSHLPSPPSPPASPVPLASGRRSLTVTVPRALTHTPLSLDVSDIMDDTTAWAFAPPSGRTSSSNHTSSCSPNGGMQLSPPRIPQSPATSTFSEYDPVELIIGYAALPPSPAASSTVTFSEGGRGDHQGKEKGEKKDGNNDDDEEWAVDEGLRSRWSCSTLATLAQPSSSSPQAPPSASSRLRFHLSSVARRVRVCRAAVRSEDVAVVPKVHLRTSSESALHRGGASSRAAEAATGGCATSSGLRRKPIPLELFLR